jgi:glycosyltransferase involved in cell wall biosynthesis
MVQGEYRMRIMLLSDNIMRHLSAYSKVTYSLAKALLTEGHQVAHIPLRGLKDLTMTYEGVTIYPSGENPFAEDVAIPHYANFNADMLITAKEPWCFNHIQHQAINFTPMAIIDHSPISASITSTLEYAFRVIAISRFGESELKRVGIKSNYIPHWIDLETFHYIPEKRKEIRDLFCIPQDAFTIGIIAMNRSRKMIAHQLRGVKRFVEQHPDIKTRVWLHTDIFPHQAMEPGTSVGDVGVNLLPEIRDLGLSDIVMFPDSETIAKGLPEWLPTYGFNDLDMVKLYNTLDVNLLCTGGEGAGLPYIEAAACGTVSIGTNYAAAPEYVGPGYTVPASDYIILNTPGTRYSIPDVDAIADTLYKCTSLDKDKMARRLRRHAEDYGTENVVKTYLKPFLDNAEADLRPVFTPEGQAIWRP